MSKKVWVISFELVNNEKSVYFGFLACKFQLKQ